MDVGIGLPNAVRGASGEQLVEWARRAEERGFTSLGTIDRIAYPSYEPLTVLGAAAAVTERIGLCTSVLLGPLRRNTPELAKRALSLTALSGGRFTLGIAVGAREDDFELSGVDFHERGRLLDAQLARITEIWSAEELGPMTEGAPRLIVGGYVEASFARAARFGAGWMAGGATPDQVAGMVEGLEKAWAQAERGDAPWKMALAYFSLGEDAEADARSSLADYYGYLGDEVAEQIVAGAAKDVGAVRDRLSAYEDAGCDELILFPSSSDPRQVDLLAEAAELWAGRPAGTSHVICPVTALVPARSPSRPPLRAALWQGRRE
jgi:alkanesulfonate monooxygenase SsuD/methylene tetrahydromethanopterin reductase-like flavin-dependent oxidoreductase (luciferase family)